MCLAVVVMEMRNKKKENPSAMERLSLSSNLTLELVFFNYPIWKCLKENL